MIDVYATDKANNRPESIIIYVSAHVREVEKSVCVCIYGWHAWVYMMVCVLTAHLYESLHLSCFMGGSSVNWLWLGMVLHKFTINWFLLLLGIEWFPCICIHAYEEISNKFYVVFIWYTTRLLKVLKWDFFWSNQQLKILYIYFQLTKSTLW